ncbi:MAG: ArsR/SmtB family transcription factor [Bacillota bacterium]
MSEKQFAVQAEFMKALAHPTRLHIMEILRSGEKCVCEIIPELGLEQSTVSRHLAVLKREGILQSRKDGLRVIYRAASPQIYDIIDLTIEAIRKIWTEKAEIMS